MYPEDEEISSRVNAIATKVVEVDKDPWDLLNEINEQFNLSSRGKAFYSYHNSLDLAFLLLNEESFFSQVFWKSYAQTFQVSNNLFIDDLDLKDINNIIFSLEKASVKNKDFELTARKLKKFISQNGLLRSLSKTLVEFAPTLDQWRGYGALAVLDDNDESLNSIINHGKTLLTRIIFSIYGLKVTSGLGMESYKQPDITDKDINFLVKRNLLKNTSKKNMARYKELLTTDFNSPYREYINTYVQSEKLEAQISFRGDMENDAEGHIGFYGIFDSVLKKELIKLGSIEKNEEINWGNAVDSAVSHSIGILRRLVKYRFNIFLFDGGDEESIALVAGLSNPDTIKNAINKGEIKKKKMKNGRTPIPPLEQDSTREWLLDKKRKYKFYDPIDNIRPIKDIDYSFLLKEIDKARERIEKSKKTKVVFSDNDIFVRTDKKIFGRVAEHNKNRWEWIGKGKTFKELNEKNSIYRKNITRQTFIRNQSPITQDIIYDLKSGYIEQKKDGGSGKT